MPDRIYKAYEMYGSVRKAAKVLGVTHPTVSNYLKKHGVKVKDRITSRREQATTLSGSFPDWVRKHRGSSLPRSIKELSRMSGASYDAIRSFLYRRRKRLRSRFNNLPDLRIVPGLRMRFNNFGEIDAASIDHYEFKIDMFSGTVFVKAEVFSEGEKKELEAEIQHPDEFVDRVRGLYSKLKETNHHSDPS